MALSTESQKGFTLVETIVAISVLLVVVVGGLSANNITTTTVGLNKQRSRANFLAREGIEALQSVRAANFTSLSPGEFYPVFDQNGWRLAPGSEQISGGFTRSIILTTVQRGVACSNPICDLTSGGGITDPNTFKAKVRVMWKESGGDKEYTLDTLITYWR